MKLKLKPLINKLEEIENGEVSIEESIQFLAKTFRFILERFVNKKKFKSKKDYYI